LPPLISDAERIQLGKHCDNRLPCSACDGRAQPMAGIKMSSDHSDQRHVIRARPQHLCCHKALRKGGRVGIKPLRGLRAEDVGFVVQQNGPGRMFVGGNAIHKNDCV
jgi:hypothetical protein